MPCGQPCKEILDLARRLIATVQKDIATLDGALGCMQNSIIDAGIPPSSELRQKFKDAAEMLKSSVRNDSDRLAVIAGEIEAYVTAQTETP